MPPRTASDVEACAQDLLETLPVALRWMRSEIRSHGQPPWSLPQLQALGFIRLHPGGSLSDLAAHLGVGLPAASALVSRLVGRGHLSRAEDPLERRRVVLTLTPESDAQLEAALAATRARLAQLMADLRPPDVDRLCAAVGTLRSLFEVATATQNPAGR